MSWRKQSILCLQYETRYALPLSRAYFRLPTKCPPIQSSDAACLRSYRARFTDSGPLLSENVVLEELCLVTSPC